ncbi:hypothetical protein K8N77_004812 [Salmonella enterica]|nr:hypothetical protein [Salmonella enterica]
MFLTTTNGGEEDQTIFRKRVKPGHDDASSLCLTFLGCVLRLPMSDNLKSMVKKAERYEPVINES